VETSEHHAEAADGDEHYDTLAVVREQVGVVRGELAELRRALDPEPSDGYDALGVVRSQLVEIRSSLAAVRTRLVDLAPPTSR
jgi:hypothetical protein